MTEEPAVRARGLAKSFDGRVAVADVDLDVAQGTVHGLLGPNGAGKTTFMRMLFGLVAPDAGTLEVFGRTWPGDGVAVLGPVAGFVESPRFYPYLTGRADLRMLSTLDRRGDDGDARVREVLSDRICQMTWAGQPDPGTFELNVHANSCWTASGPGGEVGSFTVQDTAGREVTNPVYGVDVCMDPGAST